MHLAALGLKPVGAPVPLFAVRILAVKFVPVEDVAGEGSLGGWRVQLGSVAKVVADIAVAAVIGLSIAENFGTARQEHNLGLQIER